MKHRHTSFIITLIAMLASPLSVSAGPLYQLGSGGTVNPSTDKLVAIRNGGGPSNPDVLVGVGSAATQPSTAFAPATTGTALLKGNGAGGFSNGVAGTDFQAPLSLTTTGSSGPSTLSGSILNIPQYSGGSSTPGGVSGQLQANINGAFAGINSSLIRGIPALQFSSVYAYGDHNTIAPNTPAPGTDYGTLISADMNAIYTNKGADQTQTCDSFDSELIYSLQPGNTGNPLYLFLPSNGDPTYGNTSHQTDVNRCYQAALAWAAVPAANKVVGQNSSCVQTGTWANDPAFGGAVGVNSAANGSILTCTVTTNGGPIYAWYRQHVADGGSFTYSVDGGAASSAVLTAPSYSAGLNFGGLNGQYGGALIRVGSVSAGTHTIAFNVTSTTNASNNVFILGVGTPQTLAYQGGGPTIFAGGMPYNQSNAYASLNLGYDALFKSSVSQLQQDGLNVNFADVKRYLNYTSDYASVTSLNATGEMHVRDAFEGQLQFVKNPSASASIGVVDPRNYGAACNVKAFFNGSYGSAYNAVTTTAGSPVISISGYTFRDGTATQTGGGDVGKRISITGAGAGGAANDVGPSTYIASVNTANNTATLGVNMVLTGYSSQAVMGGYPTNPADPSTAADDTNYIVAAATAANSLGAKVYLPKNCGVHNLILPTGTWLDGAMGGTNYGSAAVGDLTNTPLYYFSNGYAEDPHLGINVATSKNIRLSNFSSVCAMSPYLGYSGMTFAGIGSESNATLFPEGVLLDHLTHFLCPVQYGVPFGMNQGVVFTASATNGTMAVSAITSSNFNAAYGGYTAINGDWLTAGRPINLAVINASVSSGTLNVSSISAGTVAVGETFTNGYGTNYGTVTALGTGTGGVGTYTVSGSASAAGGTYMQALGSITASAIAGGTGNYTITPAITFASTAFYSPPIGVFLSGQTRFNQFAQGGVGINGDLSDFAEVGSVFTGSYAKCMYLGPNTGGSSGNSANRFSLTRFEECNEGAVVIDGSFQDQFNGVQWQFNSGYAIETKTAWGDITVTGGLMEGNGTNDGSPGNSPLLSHVSLGGTGSGFSLDGVDWVKNNYNIGGTDYTNYLISNKVGSSADYVSINGGAAKNGSSVGIANWAAGQPVHYKQNSNGLPFIDSSQAYLNSSGLLKGNAAGGMATAILNTDYQGAITLTTTGSAGAATLTGSTLNIPQYSGGGASVSVTAATPDIVITPSPGTGTFTIGTTNNLHALGTATTYTVLSTDLGKIVTNNSSSAVAITLPAANVTGFGNGAAFNEINIGAGSVVITPNSPSTINGAATLTLAQNQSSWIISDGTNYYAALGVGSAGVAGCGAACSPTGSSVPVNGMYLPSSGTLSFAVGSTHTLDITANNLTLTGNSTNAVGLALANTTGHTYAFFSTGSANLPGNFGIYDGTTNSTPLNIYSGTGTAGSTVNIQSGGVYCWSSSSGFPSQGTCDTGLSRVGTNFVAVGNGTSGNASAYLEYGVGVKTAPQTTVGGSTSGSCIFGEPEAGPSDKKVLVYCSNLVGTASYNFNTAFLHTPNVVSTNGPASTVVTTLTTSTMTITGTTTSGVIEVIGF